MLGLLEWIGSQNHHSCTLSTGIFQNNPYANKLPREFGSQGRGGAGGGKMQRYIILSECEGRAGGIQIQWGTNQGCKNVDFGVGYGAKDTNKRCRVGGGDAWCPG